MNNALPRILLSLSALGLAAGGIIHALPFRRALEVIDAASMPAFFANAYKVLWLSDSAALIVTASIFAAAAWRPAMVSRATIALLALLPLSGAALIYIFIGSFFAAHLLGACGLAALLGTLRPALAQSTI